MPENEDDQFVFGNSAHDCLEELRNRGMSDTNFTTPFHMALQKENVEALTKVVASMRAKVQSHDVQRLQLLLFRLVFHSQRLRTA